MSENTSETDLEAAEAPTRSASSKDSGVWKYVGGIGLGISVPLLLIALTTADNPETPASEPGRIFAIALPIAILSLCLCYVDQIHARVRGSAD